MCKLLRVNRYFFDIYTEKKYFNFKSEINLQAVSVMFSFCVSCVSCEQCTDVGRDTLNTLSALSISRFENNWSIYLFIFLVDANLGALLTICRDLF